MTNSRNRNRSRRTPNSGSAYQAAVKRASTPKPGGAKAVKKTQRGRRK